MPGSDQDKPKTFQDVLSGDFCKYIKGDIKAGTAVFCSEKRAGRWPYCEKHAKKCFRKVVMRAETEERLANME